MEALGFQDFINLVNKRSIDLTKRICLIGMVFTIVLGIIVLLRGATTNLTIQIWAIGFVFGSLYFMIKYGFHKSGRLLLTFIVPIGILTISILNKKSAIELGRIINISFFDIRFVLIALIALPIVSFNVNEKKLLYTGLIPSFLSLVLFDPIHSFFDVGPKHVGYLDTNYDVITNFCVLLTYLFVGLSLMYMKFQSENHEIALYKQAEKVEKMLEQIIRTAKKPETLSGNMGKMYASICKSVTKTIGNNRTGIWLFNNDMSKLSSQIVLEGGIVATNRIELSRIDNPLYFRNILEKNMIISNDVISDVILSELRENYFRPYNIRSMMDVVIRHKGRVIGVLCCENQLVEKKWDSDDLMFMNSMSDLIGGALDANEIRELNEELSASNEELSTISEDLEVRVKKRKSEIREKINQLTEYAFVNSHILRAPVTRISGLLNIWQLETSDEEKEKISTMLHLSLDELKSITSRIDSVVKKFGEFTRQDFDSK